MKTVKFENELYSVEEEFHDSYLLSGNIWVKKDMCEEIHDIPIVLTILARTTIVLIIIILFTL